MSFVFYDLETTGRSPAYDQPLQFAAILTDDNFQTLERVNLRCRLAPHILPSPSALAVTGVGLDQLVDPALPSWFMMMQQIQGMVARWAPATWTGYNSIRFDENFLRQSFYQTLQPEVFATQLHSNTRFDVMHVVFAVFVKAPEVLEWPRDRKGKVVFKLDQLAPANGYEDHNAHDALGDVEATIHLLKRVKERAPEIFGEVVAIRNKAHVIRMLESGEPLEFISRVGGSMPRAFIGTGCGFDANSANTAGFFDVQSNDPQTFFDLDVAGLMDVLNQSPRVVRKLKINEAPMLFAARSESETERARCSSIAANADFRRNLGSAMAEAAAKMYPAPAPDGKVRIEERIFDGFYRASDKQLLRAFNQSENWGARLTVVEKFEDERLRQLGMRAAALNAPEYLPPNVVASAAQSILSKWTAEEVPRNGWSTFASIEVEIEELLQAGRIDAEQVNELRVFYKSRFDKLKNGAIP